MTPWRSVGEKVGSHCTCLSFLPREESFLFSLDCEFTEYRAHIVFDFFLVYTSGPALTQSRHSANDADLLDPRSRREDANQTITAPGAGVMLMTNRCGKSGLGSGCAEVLGSIARGCLLNELPLTLFI